MVTQSEPSPYLRMRVGSEDLGIFLAVGSRVAREIEEAVVRSGKTISGIGNILDFGCGCARVTRFFLGRASEYAGASFHGVDLDRESIDWCKATYPGAEFDVNPPAPPTKYTDGFFGLIFAVSVFTHLNKEHTEAWLLEFKRLLRPGGLAIVTTMGDALRHKLNVDELAVLDRDGFLPVSHPELTCYHDSSRFFTYHSNKHMKELCSRHFSVLEYVSQGANSDQDLIVLGKQEK